MKRSQHRLPMTLDRMAYPSDLSDKQWEQVESLVPSISPEAAYAVHTRREIVNAILYVLRSGCPWRLLPHEFPAWQTAYHSFRVWQREGTWDLLLKTLRMQVRQKQGRDPEPSAAIIDSQSIKTSAVPGIERGARCRKKIWGRKRHLLVDTQGFVLAVHVHAATIVDRVGARLLLAGQQDRLPKVSHLFADRGYTGPLEEWVKEHLGWDTEIVPHEHNDAQSEWELIDGKAVKKPKPKAGFQVQRKRWVVERTFGWLTRQRRLARDHEGLPQCSEALIKLASSARMLTLLVPSRPSY